MKIKRLSPSETAHEIRVCSRCHRRPAACTCADGLVGTGDSRRGGTMKKVASIHAREVVTEKVLTRPAVAEVVEIVLTAVERHGVGRVRWGIKSDGDPLAEATDAADLRVLRRALLGEDHSDRHSSVGARRTVRS